MPTYSKGDTCSMKFGVPLEDRIRFDQACKKAGITMAEALRLIVKEWALEVESWE